MPIRTLLLKPRGAKVSGLRNSVAFASRAGDAETQARCGAAMPPAGTSTAAGASKVKRPELSTKYVHTTKKDPSPSNRPSNRAPASSRHAGNKASATPRKVSGAASEKKAGSSSLPSVAETAEASMDESVTPPSAPSKPSTSTKVSAKSASKSGEKSSKTPNSSGKSSDKGPSGKASGGGGAKKNKLDYMTSEYLQELAQQFAAQAEEEEKTASTLVGLSAELGEMLDKKFQESGAATDTKKQKEFFSVLDKNNDGTISKMEFRQALRNLGLMDGKRYTAKDVDALYMELDKDGSKDLDLNEIQGALKALRLEAKEVAEKQSIKMRVVEMWRARAQETREAAEVVATWEQAVKDLQTVLVPTAEAELGSVLARKNLKPADIVTQWDSDGGGSIGEMEFITNFQKLGVELSTEVLTGVFKNLDKSGDGELDMVELKAALKQLTEIREENKEKHKKLTKSVSQKEAEAREAQQETKLKIEADQKRQEEEEAKRKEAEEAEKAEKEAKKAELEAKKAEKLAQEEAEKKAFEEKVKARRSLQRQNTLAMTLPPTPPPDVSPPPDS